MPPKDWEIILIDDMSTEDLSKTYNHLRGKINLRHVKMDHKRHIVWKTRNQNGTTGDFENWFHTPAISNNIGFHLARGSVICLCHPEILHAETNFEVAYRRLQTEKTYLFGKTYLGTQVANQWLNENPSWMASWKWDDYIREINKVDPLKAFGPTELYWYTSFLPKEAVVKIQGVDFSYLNGVAGEDDDFKERVRLAGWPPIYAPEIQGFHQDHSDEKEKHRLRDTKEWEDGLRQNRQVFSTRVKYSGFPMPANQGFDWTAQDCIVSIDESKVS
jgi:hypothetical protein